MEFTPSRARPMSEELNFGNGTAGLNFTGRAKFETLIDFARF